MLHRRYQTMFVLRCTVQCTHNTSTCNDSHIFHTFNYMNIWFKPTENDLHSGKMGKLASARFVLYVVIVFVHKRNMASVKKIDAVYCVRQTNTNLYNFTNRSWINVYNGTFGTWNMEQAGNYMRPNGMWATDVERCSQYSTVRSNLDHSVKEENRMKIISLLWAHRVHNRIQIV